jgi:heme A synthase
VTPGRTPGAAALALGFGTAVAMWAVGFVARMPPAPAPSAPLLGALLGVLLVGGGVAGRFGTWRLGAATGLVASLVNLLVLGSVLSGTRSGGAVPAAAIWAPGSLVLGLLVGAAGGALGARFPSRDGEADWTSALARVAAVATLLLVAVGGLVTSENAGLAVVDWPNSYGYNMFLFPLSRMVGGIFYEHAHRLLGSLVGLTTLVLCIRVFRTDARGRFRALAAGALLLVVGQGVLGGLRVTGHFTMSDSVAVTRPNLTLAMVHGMTGQIFFAWMAMLATLASPTWKRGPIRAAGFPDRVLPLVLVGGLFVQLLLGVRVRHLGASPLPHVAFALMLLLLAAAAGVRTLVTFGSVAVLRRTGRALIAVAVAQVLLGGWALVTVGRDPAAPPNAMQVVATTLHQTTGALFLATAVVLALWLRRVAPAGGDAP